MKKTLAIALALVLCLGLLAACGEPASDPTDAPVSDAPQSEAPSNEPIELSGTVVVNGSTSMGDVINALTEGFNEINPDVQISYTGSGSSAGIEGVLAGSCDLGLSSRELSEDELGGNDAEIAVFGRDAASGTRSAFEEILGIEDKCAYLNEYSTTGDVIGNVASNPNAIGYASLSAVNETVTAVAVDGVAPSEATVADGSFPIQRPFVIVTVEGTELSAEAKAFLDYAMSAEVAEIIAAAGAVSANA